MKAFVLPGLVLIFLAVGALKSTAADSQSKPVTPAGRVELFNGMDSTGLTFCMKDDSDPAKTWSVTNGCIHCTGSPTGYLRTEQSFRNFELTVEWRFVKAEPKRDNTGVLVYIQPPDEVWPRCIQCQGKHTAQGDMFLMNGAESKEHRGMDMNTPVPKKGDSNENPVGEWNTCKMICHGNDVKALINGKQMNELTDCSISSGFIGIQSEGAEIEIRKMFIEPLN